MITCDVSPMSRCPLGNIGLLDGKSGAQVSGYCNVKAKDFEQLGKSVISSTAAQTYYQYWWGFTTIRDGTRGTEDGDVIHLGFKGDSVVAGLGDDFIEVENEDITVYADVWPLPGGGNDVIVIRCNKNIYVEGHGGSDQYYINILPKFVDAVKGTIIISELPSKIDHNTIIFCGASFNPNPQQGYFGLKLYRGAGDLLIYLNYADASSSPTEVRVRNFCEYQNSDEKLLYALVDGDGTTLLADEISCDNLTELVYHDSHLAS
ncbi:hypothetical protein MIDIC_170023 [Alphaproteobacteria bacterium]